MRRLMGIFFVFILINTALTKEMASFNFLRTHVGARTAALAGASVAIPGDIHAIYYNPAGLAEITNRVGSLTYLKHVLDFNSGFLGYAQKFDQLTTLGAGIHYMDYGTFDRTDPNGVKDGTFGANSFVVTASVGRQLIDGLLGGVSVKYVRSAIDQYSADAVALDAGVIWHAFFMEDLTIGLAILNLGKATSAFIDTKEELPLKIEGGFSKKLAHLPLLFNGGVYKYSDADFQFKIAGEFTLTEGIFLRLGYNSVGRDQRVSSDLDRVAGASIGLGFNWKNYALDYALSSLGEVGSLNRITFSASF